MNPATTYHRIGEITRDFVISAGFSDVVLGLSGGLDSALATTVCVDVLGASHVHGILMPGPFSSSHSVEDAHALAHNLGISQQSISITAPYEAFIQALVESCETPLEGVVSENIQARCRMIVLMALSNQYGWMMINTGNKSEALMGYSTLYGDMAGAFAPLGDLYKTEVYALSVWRNEEARKRGECPPMPQNTLKKAPSAELSPHQEDETSMGISYAQLDPILKALDANIPLSQITKENVPLAEVQRIASIVQANCFKKSQLPPHP